MSKRFSALLIASLAGLMLSGQALAAPRFPDGDWFAAREERDAGKQEERGNPKAKKPADKKAGQQAEDEKRERGYGYGYERRNLPPPHDERGRR